MKYIRTKDRVFETSWLPKERFIIEFTKIIDKQVGLPNPHIEEIEIIKQADTIEELCDEFVFIDEFFKREHRLAYSLENALARCKYHNVDITTLKGAIWTEKGLIYVAKMNEKGELELL